MIVRIVIPLGTLLFEHAECRYPFFRIMLGRHVKRAEWLLPEAPQKQMRPAGVRDAF